MRELNYNQFFTFLSIYAANADAEISEKERKSIIKIVRDELYEECYQIFKGLSDAERLDLILAHRDQFFASEEDKTKLLNKVVSIFSLDGEVNAAERAQMLFLKKLI